MAIALLDSTIGALLKFHPLYGLAILTFIITLATVLIYKYTSNQVELKRLKEESLRLREEMKLHKDNPQKLMELQKEQLKHGFSEPLKHTMIPMIITLVPLLLVFTYLRNFYSNGGSPIALFGSPGSWLAINGWILAYLVFSIVFNSLLRKWLKVH